MGVVAEGEEGFLIYLEFGQSCLLEIVNRVVLYVKIIFIDVSHNWSKSFCFFLVLCLEFVWYGYTVRSSELGIFGLIHMFKKKNKSACVYIYALIRFVCMTNINPDFPFWILFIQ